MQDEVQQSTSPFLALRTLKLESNAQFSCWQDDMPKKVLQTEACIIESKLVLVISDYVIECKLEFGILHQWPALSPVFTEKASARSQR